jgi:predicted  nucleic acid-binding Zn-ribbon protein
MTEATPTRALTREVQSAETQIATVDEQIAEQQGVIDEAELQIELMEDEIRKRRKSIRGAERRRDKLLARRSIFIDTVAQLRKVDRL